MADVSSFDPSQINGTTSMSPEEKIKLITTNLQEVLNPEIMEDVILKQNRPLTIYWGSATTGRPHCGYFVPMLQIAAFLRAGCNVKILLADIHGFLDNLKAPIELVKYRAEYYKYTIVELLKAVGVSIDKLTFVLGSSYQLTPAYQMDLLRLCTVVTEHDAKKAGSELVKQVENATLSGLIYPLMQALDEQYLDVDAQFGGVDQRKIFTLAKEQLPKIGYRQRAHFMNPMVPGLAGGKMSASEPDSKIDVLDPPDLVAKKLGKAFAPPKETDNNGILAFCQYVLLPASILRTGKANFVVERRKEGDTSEYETIEQMHADYKVDKLTPGDLKNAIGKALNELLAPVQEAYNASEEWRKIADLAYPPPPAKEKKTKTKKDKGKFYPGARVEAQDDGSVEGSDKETVDLAASASKALKELDLGKKAVEK